MPLPLGGFPALLILGSRANTDSRTAVTSEGDRGFAFTTVEVGSFLATPGVDFEDFVAVFESIAEAGLVFGGLTTPGVLVAGLRELAGSSVY